MRLLRDTFGLTLPEVYGTNLFPFVKPGGMSEHIAQKDLESAARQFGLPQIHIVNPALVVCLGLETFNALRRACDLSDVRPLDLAIRKPFNIGAIRVWCQAHTGAIGHNNRNKGGIDRVSQDWLRMKADVATIIGEGSLGSDKRPLTESLRGAASVDVYRSATQTSDLPREETRITMVDDALSSDGQGLEYATGRSAHNGWVAGAPRNWTAGTGLRGVAPACTAEVTGVGFIYVIWQVNVPKPGIVRLQVSSPTETRDPTLNKLKQEVVKALLESDLRRVLGLHWQIDERFCRTSEAQLRENKASTLFKIVLDNKDDDGSEQRIRTNIQLVHAVGGGSVYAVLQRLGLDDQLVARFGR